jgi:hypothetical protein
VHNGVHAIERAPKLLSIANVAHNQFVFLG